MKPITPFRSKILLIITALMLGLSIKDAAAAENFRTDKTNETHNGTFAILQVPFNHNVKQHDASYAISPDAVLYKLKQKQKISLIDVRNPENFERLHIAGSLNIPLHAVKTKAFLRSFAVVLINAGFQYSLLLSECRKLTDLGFKAYILDGGLLAWNRKGGRLVGDLFALQDMKTVSPRVLLEEKDFKNTLVIDISPVLTEISRQLIPYSRHLPVYTEPGDWFQMLNGIIPDHKNRPFLSVLVFSEIGDGYDEVNKILADLNVNAFYLQGGVAGYNKYLQDLLLSRLPRRSRIKTNRKCRSCGGEIEEKIVTKGREWGK